MDIDIRRLDPKNLVEKAVIFQYDSPGHYKVSIDEREDGWTIDLSREDFPVTFHKSEEEQIISHFKGNSEIYGAFVNGIEAGFIQFEYQEWNKSVRVWDIDIAAEYRRKGIGMALMDRCKSRSVEMGARRIVLETQTSNLKAIEFYKAMGFRLMGLDASHYSNNDIAKCEVRLEMAFHLGIPK